MFLEIGIENNTPLARAQPQQSHPQTEVHHA